MQHENQLRNQTNESLLKALDLTGNFGQDIIERINYSIKDVNTDCLPSCKVQENPNQKSFVFYPQRNNFFYKIEFCNVASHILQMSCRNGDTEEKGQFRKELLDKKYPKLCSTLEDFKDFFGSGSTCDNWPEIYFETGNKQFNVVLIFFLFTCVNARLLNKQGRINKASLMIKTIIGTACFLNLLD